MGIHFCLGFCGDPEGDVLIRILSDGTEVGHINTQASSSLELPPDESRSGIGQLIGNGWALVPMRIAGTPTSLILLKEGTYHLVFRGADNIERSIGEFSCFLVNPSPLTPERIAAIRSDPYASKAVRFALGYQTCTSKLRAYAGLEHLPNLEADGYLWYRDLDAVSTIT